MKKFNTIVVCMLVCLSSFLIIPDDLKVEASGGGGEGNSGETGLDFDYLEKQIKKVARVIHTAYDPGDIRKGRFMGSKGGNYTCYEIIKKQMDNMGLSNVRTEEIKQIGNEKVYYNRLLEVIGYNLTVNNDDIPKSEVFPNPSAKEINGSLDYIIIFNESKVMYKNFRKGVINTIFDLDYVISDYDTYNDEYYEFIGKLEYITEEQQTPDPGDQEGKVYLFDWDNDSQDIIDNLTYATGVVLINISQRTTLNLSNNSYQVKEINESEGDYLKEICENHSDILIDTLMSENITIYYELNNSCLPDSDYVVIDRIPDHIELKNSKSKFLKRINKKIYDSSFPYPNILHYTTAVGIWQYIFDLINELPCLYKCKGFILYSSFDHHLMQPTFVEWAEIEGYFGNTNSGPISMFCINETLGNYINNTKDDNPPTTISGDIHQKYYAGTEENPGVVAHNAIGELNIDKSPKDKYVIISNRYDGMWGETPSDSGIGTAIVLALARHQKDLQENHSIDPKYNITYLFTTGEEIGFRGAYFHRDNLSQNGNLGKVHKWIGFDQLGQNQSDLVTAPELRSPNNGPNATNYSKVVWAIANNTNYESQSGYDFEPSVETKAGGSEDFVWGKEVCDTIVFVKDNTRAWERWHTTGDNYRKGDSLNYTDYEDANLTYKIAWHFVKYICYNPNCLFESLTRQCFDSSNDSDELSDSINASFTIKTKLPYDNVLVNASLVNESSGEVVANKTIVYHITANKINASIILTLPEDKSAGLYELYLELYNSTGRIKKIIGQGDYYNDTSGLHLYYYLYPFSPDTALPEITNVTNNPNKVGFGFSVTINAEVNDNGSGIDFVKINITYPDDSYGNFSMNDIGNNTYQYISSNSWIVGQYNYTIWTTDLAGNTNSSSGHSFNVSAQADISVCTVKDNYTSNEIINLTDPPRAALGYELLDGNNVLYIWNKHNGYYFNTSSGIQITNHYDEYWSHNVLMLGYYNNDQWNLIYRTDELSGFNKEIDTDNETYVNVTLWKDLTYEGYDFRLTIKYHLGEDDPDLTVIPYIKNLGDAIPYNLAFGWEIKDIKIANTYENDTIRLYNGTDWISYSLHQTLNNTYTNMDYNTTFYLEGHNEDEYLKRTLYLRWNHTLDYILKVKSRTGQYNAPVTLFIKIGTLAVDQEKYTEMNWLDSDKWLGVNGWNYHSSCGHTWPDNPWGALNGTGVWAHMTNESHWLVIDLNETYNIKKIRGRSDTSDDPTSVDIYISDDPTCWGSAVHTGITTWQDTSTWAEVDITDTVGRYVNISITDTEGMAGDNYLIFGKLPTPMTILDVYGRKVSTATYYFNSYDTNQAWATNPANMVDGNTSNFASTTIDGDLELCNGNTCSGTTLGNITKVELRAYGYYASNQRDIILRPVFGGINLGSEYPYETTSTAGWSPWFDITDDAQAPGSWDWADIDNLDCEVTAEFILGGPMFTLYCSKVEIRVVYDPGAQISNPYPADGSTGVSLTPTLNITVTHPRGNTMDITWLSNSSGSWQIFGTNNSVTNGTYRQTFSNATESGKWWYWKVNVSDGSSYNISDVYKFYTGVQSKIKNTGTTSIKGYLLIQVQCYNTSSTKWIVANDTINETSPRTIHWDDPNTSSQHILALDTIFNGLVNTSSLSSYGNGTYRIYAAFRDPDGNILKCDDETELVATYEFTVTF